VCHKTYKLRYTYEYTEPFTHERHKVIEEYHEKDEPEMLRTYRLCVAEGDKKFIRMQKYSKLAEVEALQTDAPILLNERQRERQKQLDRIRNMSDAERENTLSRLETDKPYITCSSCRRKGHNANNKYCPHFFKNRQRKQQQQQHELAQANANDAVAGVHDDEAQAHADPFIDRALVRYDRDITQKYSKKRGRHGKWQHQHQKRKLDDPRLDLLTFCEGVLTKIKKIENWHIFDTDPTVLANYTKCVQTPVCLTWIRENIEYTRQCIKAPFATAESSMSSRLIDVSRGTQLPQKKQYKTFVDFKDDIGLILKNSVLFNGQSSPYTSVAQRMVEEVESSQRRYGEMLTKMDNAVKQTYLTFDLHPILNEIINGILDAPTLSAFTSIRDRLQHNPKERVMGLYQIRQHVHDKHYQCFADFVCDLKKLQQFCFELNKPEFQTGLKILPTQFGVKLEPWKERLIAIDASAEQHFELNKTPPYY